MPTALDDINLSVNPFAHLIPDESLGENPFAHLIPKQPASDDSYEGQLKHLGITPERERQAKGTALRAELAFEQKDQLEEEARRQAIADFNQRQAGADNPLSRTEFGRALARGTMQMGEGFSGAAETVSKLFGGPDAGQTPKALGDYFAAQAAAIPAAVPSLRDVDSVGTFAEYGAKALGELTPQIVTSMIPAVGAAKLGRAVGLGKKGIAALTGAGAASTSIPQEVGGMFREIRDTTGQEAPLTAIAFGTPAGLLDAITPGRLVGKVLGATSKEAKKLAWREVVRNAVFEIPKSAATEGLTEPVQEALAIAAVKTADSSYDAVNEENFWRLLDAAAMGAIGGGVFGGGTTVGATALNKVSRNQEALKLKNLRRGRDDARSRLVDRRFDLEPIETSGGMPTPEVSLPPEFIALQQNIDEQQRAKAAQEVQEPVIPAIPKAEADGGSTAAVPRLGVRAVAETPDAPRGLAPVTFLEDQSHLIPGLIWYQIQEDITSPEGGMYPKGRNITSGELLRFGYTLPPTPAARESYTKEAVPWLEEHLWKEAVSLALNSERARKTISLKDKLDIQDGAVPWPTDILGDEREYTDRALREEIKSMERETDNMFTRAGQPLPKDALDRLRIDHPNPIDYANALDKGIRRSKETGFALFSYWVQERGSEGTTKGGTETREVTTTPKQTPVVQPAVGGVTPKIERPPDILVPTSAPEPPVAVAQQPAAATGQLRIPAINKGTRETTDLSAFRIPLPTDVLLIDAQGNSPSPEQVRLTYRTSGKNPGLRLYVDNRPAYEITLPAGAFAKDATGVFVDSLALMDTANWKRVGKTPERSPFTLERDTKKKPVAQQRAAESDKPVSQVAGVPIAPNFTIEEERIAIEHQDKGDVPAAVRAIIENSPDLVASYNSPDQSAVIAAVEQAIKANAAKVGARLQAAGEARRLAQGVIEQMKADEPMLMISPGARLVPTRVIASGKGAVEITALLTNPAIDPAVAANGRKLLAALPPQYTDGLTLNIVERQEHDGPKVTQSGSFAAASSIATILQNATDENTALHEISHWLSTFLNPVERARNNQLWRQELDRELATATGDRLTVLQAIKDANGLTSQEYMAQSQNDTSTYHLSNPDEFFAYRFTNQARAELKRDNAIDYVRNLLKRILEAVKRLVGRGDFYDAVWRKFMAGEFSVDARSGPLFERNKYGVAASLEPISSRDAYQSFMRGSQTATPDINRFKQTVSWFQNESVVGRITNSFAALPRGVKSELEFLRGRIAAMADALADLGTAPNVTGDVVTRAQALSPDPIEQNQLLFSVVNNTMEVEHAGRALEQRVDELDKELRVVQAKDTKDSAFADLANDILSKAPPAQRTLLRQSNMTVFLEGGTIGVAETAQAVAATASYANLAAKVADANSGISRKQRILEYQLNNATQARQFVASQVLSDPRTQQDYREAIAARGVRAVVLNETGGTITYQDPLAPNDRSKDVTVSFSLDAADILVNQQKLLDLAAKMEQYLQTGTDELRKAAYVDELDRIWNYHLSTRNFPSTGKLLFGNGDVFRWLTFGGRVAIPDYITKFIGGEPARKLSIALKNYSEARQQAMNHHDRLRQNIYTAVYRAAKAHKMTRAEWMRKVGKPILDSHAAFGAVRPLKTGMKLPGNIVVLRSDMEAIEAQATFFRIVAGSVAEMSTKLSAAQPSPVLIYEQATPKRPAYERKPLQASRFMLPRMIGRQWRNLAARWLVAQKAGNVAELIEMVNDPAHWNGFLSHLRAYEDPSYLIKSDFVQAYRMVQQEIYDGNVPADFDSLVTMVDLELGGTVPRADIGEKMLGEFTEVMRLLNNPVTPSEVDVSIISAENFMNNPRGRSIAPPGMYEIGLDTEGSQFSLISQVAEVYGQRYFNALKGVQEALERKAVEYRGKEKSGVTRKQVEKDSREAQIAGDTFVNYQELLTLQKQVFHQLQQFKELAQSKQGFDVEMSRGLRLLGNITGSLLQTPGVLFRNSLGGPIRAVGIDAAIGYSTSIFGIRLQILSTALNTSKNALLFARGARQLAMGMISNRMARTAAGRAALRTLQRNPTFWNSTAQWLASVMNKNAQAYQTADDLGLLKEAPIKEQIGNYFRLFSEGGRIVGDDPKAMAKFIRRFESVVGIIFELGIPIANFPRKLLPAFIDDALNVASDYVTAPITKWVSQNALKSLATRASLNARTDELTPQEVLGRSGATAKQLEWLRLLFDQNNISLDRALIEYYQNVEAAKAAGQDPNAVQFLTPQQYDSLRLTFANELNRAGFMNRPALFAKSPLARAFGTFFGYPAQTNTQFSVFMSKHSRDTRTLAGREGFLLAMQMMLMIIIFGTLIAAPGADLLHRLFYNRERQVPQLSSAKDGWDFARIAFMQSGALMPTVGGVFNYMIEQTKPGMGMGGSGVSLLPLSLYNGTMDALRAAYQTGDVIRPAVSFIRRWIPNTQIVLNRTPFMEGSIEGGNVRAILDRNAPTSIERRGFGFGGNIKRSATSDDIDGIVNAIYRGETATAQRLTAKAVEERRAAGIAKPENSVYSSVLSRNPYNSLFGKTLTEGERELVFSRLKPQDRARVIRAEDAFQSYAQSSGRNEPTFVSNRGTIPRRSRSRTRSYRSRSRRFSVRSRNRFRIRGLGRRRNLRLLRI